MVVGGGGERSTGGSVEAFLVEMNQKSRTGISLICRLARGGLNV